MSMSSVSERLARVEVRTVKARLRTGSESEPLEGGSLVRHALGGMPLKAAAEDMGISDSLLARGLNDIDHLSFQRLMRLPADVRARIALGILKDCNADIETRVTVKGA